MTQRFEVETPEAVGIQYQVAGLGSRFLAAILDSFCIASYVAAVLYAALLLQLARATLQPGTGIGDVIILLSILSVFLLIWGYHIVLETLWEGQTIGKRTFNLRVVKTSGAPIGFQEAFIRNIVRFVDFLPVLYGVGVVVAFISTESRRLGDYAAGTIVVRDKPSVRLRDVVPRARSLDDAPRIPRGALDPDELVWDTSALGTEELQVVRAFLQRAPSLAPEARSRLGASIAERVASVIGSRDPLQPEPFLQRVLTLRDQE